jgi:hypothetical protein
MNRKRFIAGLLCTSAAYYAIMQWKNSLPRNPNVINSSDKWAIGCPNPSKVNVVSHEKEFDSILVHDTTIRSLWAYDNSNHKSLVHVRFDTQTVDLMNKFKMAAGVDITKFVAFAVKYFFETNPELKTVIKQFIQNTKL